MRIRITSAVTVAVGLAGIAAAQAPADIAPGDLPDPPKVTDVTCARTCGGIRIATQDSLVTISGRHLADVVKVKFREAGGGWISTAPTLVEAQQVQARVPEGTVTGRVRVRDSIDRDGESEEQLKIVAPEDIPTAEEFELRSAVASPSVVYVGGRQPAKLDYSFAAKGPTDIRVDVVDTGGAIIQTMVVRRAEPFAGNELTWNGNTSEGADAPAGRYEFRVGPVTAGNGKSKPKSEFRLVAYKFPILGSHSYGDGFGAGRGHDGQDVFAKCGTPLVAARGGRIQANSFQSAAGNYVILDPVGTKRDFIYMHMRERSPIKEGRRVYTGQRLGKVGATGRATGCHLHFEVWSAPGAWTDGGHPMAAVTDILRRWDRQS